MKIRKSIFETNSSSSHSFSMGPEGRFGATLEIDADGVIHIPSDSWLDLGEQKTNDPQIKLSYLLSFVWTISPEDEWERYRDAVYKAVMDFTGASSIDFTPDEDVDHQSQDIIDLRDVLNPEFVKEFVFNPDTWLYLLWDSDCPERSYFEDEEHKVDLYRVTFNLPGIDPKYTILEISYSEASNIDYQVYMFLKKFVYCPELDKFFGPNIIPDNHVWEYWKDLKFGESEEKCYKIDQPKIEIA